MGMPDIIVDTKHPLEHHFINLFPSEKVFIYYWRGMHDYLYFMLRNDIIFNT